MGEEWALVGGEMEFGETPKHAALREMHEEIGFQPRDLQLFKTYTATYSDGITRTIHVFLAAFPGTEKLRSSLEVDVAELKLFTLSEAQKQKTFPVAYQIFSDLADAQRNGQLFPKKNR